MKRVFQMAMIALVLYSGVTSCSNNEYQDPGKEEDEPTLPYGDVPDFEYELYEPMTDEFESNVIDYTKWKNVEEIGYWGQWSWTDTNVRIEDGKLCLDTKYQEHKRKDGVLYFSNLDDIEDGKKMFFTSGIVITKEVLRYGYYEAKIKNCEIDQGVCPAYWLQATGYNKDGRKVSGSEIDILEIPSSYYDTHISTNFHGTPDLDDDDDTSNNSGIVVSRKYEHGWSSPYADYHIYGCLATPDYVAFYIDGKLVYTDVNHNNNNFSITDGVDPTPYYTQPAWVTDYATPDYAIPNMHWSVPMNLKLSVGIRSPYRATKTSVAEPPEGWSEEDGTWPVEETSVRDKLLFPVTMKVEYARTWKIKGFEE